MGGMVLETNMNEIVAQIEAQNRLEKSEVRRSGGLGGGSRARCLCCSQAVGNDSAPLPSSSICQPDLKVSPGN
jgi:hypothetical protein